MIVMGKGGVRFEPDWLYKCSACGAPTTFMDTISIADGRIIGYPNRIVYACRHEMNLGQPHPPVGTVVTVSGQTPA